MSPDDRTPSATPLRVATPRPREAQPASGPPQAAPARPAPAGATAKARPAGPTKPAGAKKPSPPGRKSRQLALGAIALTILAAGLAVVSMQQADRSDLAVAAAERETQAVERTLARRTKELATRTQELRLAEARIRAGQVATTATAGQATIAQHRLDATRARIAADRAELEAQAQVLGVIATAFQSCRSGTQQLLAYVLADDYVTASAVMDAVFARCTTADDRLEAYHSTYGR